MALVDRAQKMLTTPKTEWPVVAVEPATVQTLYSGYIIPLALISPICSFISTLVFAHRSILLAAVISIVSFVLSLVIVYVVALIADYLSPSFGGTKDPIQALKWIAYAYTPAWVAGVALLIPVVGPLISLLGGLYALYVLFLGANPVMRVPQEKALGYVAVLIILEIVLTFIVGAVLGVLVAVLSVGAAIQGAH